MGGALQNGARAVGEVGSGGLRELLVVFSVAAQRPCEPDVPR